MDKIDSTVRDADYQFDVLIIGTGIAGLSAAIKLAEKNLKVGIVTREDDPRECNTCWAQGGIIYPINDLNLFIEDVMKASNNTSNLSAVNVLACRAAGILKEILLDKANVPFEKDRKSNELKFTKEAAHSISRILYTGDYTGRMIQEAMLTYLLDKSEINHKNKNITLLNSHTAIDLITPSHHGVDLNQRYEKHKVVGAYLFNQKNERVYKVISRKTILATGGLGSIYLHHSNSEGIRGDGLAMAKRVGAFISNMEFIQFHPTTFYDRSSHRRFLISEAVRGEGGILLNQKGEPFMKRYHAQKELAPRDIVARAILQEMITSGQHCVYLDISFKEETWIKERFPTIYANCLKAGVDITKSAIPVVPAAHYSCGGIKVDEHGETNITNLYAIGEVSCTGIHGANRLASTSLLEGLVYGYLAADAICNQFTFEEVIHYDGRRIKDWVSGKTEYDLALILQDWSILKQTMWNYVGPVRSIERLKRARAMFKELSEEVFNFYFDAKLHDELIGLRNAIEVASIIVDSSIRNRKSVGCFYLTETESESDQK
ncbi:MAG: FAD-binding protein [Oligoflexia bacterium]|nr:FAD-binding protein [Oligoflexia bacterium]